MTYDPGRQGKPWWTARAQRLKTARDDNEPCGICHLPLDYRRVVDGGPQPHTPEAVVIDHITPLQHGGDPLDQANLRPAHSRCNIARGNRTRHAVGTEPSRPRRWIGPGWYCDDPESACCPHSIGYEADDPAAIGLVWLE
jgi:5-methylcytosine-specific restriction endonuclease McrA